MEKSPCKSSIHSSVSELTSVLAKTPIFFVSGEGVPAEKVQFFFVREASPDKVSLSFVKGFSDFFLGILMYCIV